VALALVRKSKELYAYHISHRSDCNTRTFAYLSLVSQHYYLQMIRISCRAYFIKNINVTLRRRSPTRRGATLSSIASPVAHFISRHRLVFHQIVTQAGRNRTDRRFTLSYARVHSRRMIAGKVSSVNLR
jgi:hypothetical protein